VAVPRVVEKHSWKGWAPVFEHCDQSPCLQRRAHRTLEHVREPQPLERSLDRQTLVIEHERTRHVYGDLLLALLELPVKDLAARQAYPNALMGAEVIRRRRPAATGQVLRRGNDEAARFATKAYSGHVLRNRAAIGVLFLKSVAEGAATEVFAAANPKALPLAGSYLCDSNVGKPRVDAEDAALATRLWAKSEEIVQALPR
jgi:hypothetical protein